MSHCIWIAWSSPPNYFISIIPIWCFYCDTPLQLGIEILAYGKHWKSWHDFRVIYTLFYKYCEFLPCFVHKQPQKRQVLRGTLQNICLFFTLSSFIVSSIIMTYPSQILYTSWKITLQIVSLISCKACIVCVLRNTTLYDCANAIWSLKRTKGSHLSILVIFFCQKVLITL
jgi:hypothetical protein